MGFINKTVMGIKTDKGVDLLQQTYTKDPLPKGVTVVKINVFPDDLGGWFKENFRLSESGSFQALTESGIDFKIRQSNMSYIAPGGKRFWHIHPSQNEIWTTNAILLVGLIDLREGSETYGQKTKVILSQDKALYIPHGVAHGFINPNNFPVTLVYFADQVFKADSETEEHRIDPKTLPFDFVEPEIM